jgi:pimeloyl-ACP methyl ester carboxylesterase
VRSRVAVAVLVALAVVATACEGDDDDGTSTTPARPEATSPAPPATDGSTGEAVSPGEPGTLISAEEVAQQVVPGARAWLVRYRSETVTGDPAEVSGYLLAPATPGAERPVIAYAHPTTGSADVCAPSRALSAARPTGDAGSPIDATFAQFAHFVDEGYVVVATDYVGLGTPGPHPYLHGPSEGRSVLDAARAAVEVVGAGAGTRVVLSGWSQGGQAALWAAQLAASWAPGLDVVGVVAAAPFSEADVILTLARIVPQAAGLYAMAVLGQVAADPTLDPALVLTPRAIDAAGIVEEECLDGVSARYAELARDGGVATGDATTAPGWADHLDEMVAGLTPLGAPALVLQGDGDLVVPAATTRTLVARLCGHGDAVEAVELPGVGHGDVVVAGDAALRAWIDARLTTSEPPPTTC